MSMLWATYSTLIITQILELSSAQIAPVVEYIKSASIEILTAV